jgi:hypothetical protein
VANLIAPLRRFGRGHTMTRASTAGPSGANCEARKRPGLDFPYASRRRNSSSIVRRSCVIRMRPWLAASSRTSASGIPRSPLSAAEEKSIADSRCRTARTILCWRSASAWKRINAAAHPSWRGRVAASPKARGSPPTAGCHWPQTRGHPPPSTHRSQPCDRGRRRLHRKPWTGCPREDSLPRSARGDSPRLKAYKTESSEMRVPAR